MKSKDKEKVSRKILNMYQHQSIWDGALIRDNTAWAPNTETYRKLREKYTGQPEKEMFHKGLKFFINTYVTVALPRKPTHPAIHRFHHNSHIYHH